MKQIINGKKYDTNTAENIAVWYSDHPCTDFHWHCERLFVKKTGEFFLYGKGNSLSPYALSYGNNSWSGSAELIPLTLEETKNWVEKKANEIYETLFGEVTE